MYEYMPELIKILEYECNEPEDRWGRLGWSWKDVRVDPARLNRMLVKDLLVVKYDSNNYTGYRLSDLGRSWAEKFVGIRHDEELIGGPVVVDDTPTITDDTFSIIVGMKGTKTLLRASLLADKPVHVLLAGPPSVAKTLFLSELESLAPSVWIVGSAASKAGIWDLIANRKPRFLLIDELDKMNAVDQAALLSVMETGRIVRAKVGRGIDEQVTVWVFATANYLNKISPELKSRFAVRQLKPYSEEAFKRVVRSVLVSREHTSEDVADRIAEALVGRTQDVRDAVRVARLAPSIGVKTAAALIIGGLQP